MPLLDGSANTTVHKLRWLAPAAAAISYPFWLYGFHNRRISGKWSGIDDPDNWGGALPARCDSDAALWPGFRISNDPGGSVDQRSVRRAHLGVTGYRRACGVV
jgi:hypothetical protein